MRTCSASLAVWETQIKATMRSHLTPVRMGKIHKAGNHKCWRGCREGEPSCTVDGNVNWCSHSGKLCGFPQRVKNRSALRPSNCTAGDLPQRYRCSEMPGHLHPNISSSNGHNSHTVEGALVSIEKLWSLYTVGYSSAVRNDRYPPFASTWMDLEGIMLSEISPLEEDKHYMVSFIWGI